MKNFKNIAFGLLVAGLAISFSAFTTAKNGMKITRDAHGKIVSVTSTFYNIDGNPLNTSASNFIYRDNTTPAACVSSLSTKECEAQWTTSAMPVNNQTPTDAGSPSYVGNGVESAKYNGH